MDGPLDAQHWYTLTLGSPGPSLPHTCLELYQDPTLHTNTHWQSLQPRLQGTLSELIPQVLKIFEKENILQRIVSKDHASDTTLEVDIYWVGNPQMEAINQQYRDKGMPTDVLSFPLYDLEAEDASHPLWAQLPEVHLGAIFLSVEWALDHASASPPPCELSTIQTEPLLRYLYERLCHGLLHLMGVNHDTQEDYNRVVAIQNQVLYEFFEVHRDLA